MVQGDWYVHTRKNKTSLTDCLVPNIDSKWMETFMWDLELLRWWAGTQATHFSIEAFLKRTPEIQKMIFRIHKLDFTKQKSLCTAKETVYRAKHSWQMKRSLPTPDRGLATETQWAAKVKSTKPGELGHSFSPSPWRLKQADLGNFETRLIDLHKRLPGQPLWDCVSKGINTHTHAQMHTQIIPSVNGLMK